MLHRACKNAITPFPVTTSIPFTVFVGREIRGETKRCLESANWPPCPSFRLPMILTVKVLLEDETLFDRSRDPRGCPRFK